MASATSNWTVSTTRAGYVGSSYSYAQTTGPATTMTYIPDLPHSGTWQVDYSIPNTNGNSLVTATTVDVEHGGTLDGVVVNEKNRPAAATPNAPAWQSLGSFAFAQGTDGSVTVTSSGTGGTIVLADAIRFTDPATSTQIVVDDSAAHIDYPAVVQSPVATATTSSSVKVDWSLPAHVPDPDRVDIERSAPWTVSKTRAGFVGTSYSYADISGPSTSLVYSPVVPHAGTWALEYSIPNTNNNSLVSSTPVEIDYSGGTDTKEMHQANNALGSWPTLGQYPLQAGETVSIVVRNVRDAVTGVTTSGSIVLADAFRLVDTTTGDQVVVDDPQAALGDWSDAGGTVGSARTYTVGLLQADTSYTFRMRTRTGADVSPWVQLAPATTPDPNDAPRGTIAAPQATDDLRNGDGTLLALNNGGLLFVYARYEGTGDFAPSEIASRTSEDGGRTWSDEHILYGIAGTAASPGPQIYIQPSITRMANGDIGLTFTEATITTTAGGATSTHAHKVFASGGIDGTTWTPANMLTTVTDGSTPVITSAGGRLLTLSNGRLMQIVNLRAPASTDRSTGVYTSDDNGVTWTNRTPTTVINDVAGFFESTAAEYSPGHILMYGRPTTGDADYLWQSVSTDYGATWSTPTRSDVAEPRSPAFLQNLPGGGLVLLTNGDTSTGSRYVLASQVSTDGGATWGNYRQIEYAEPNHVTYPSMIFTADGAHIVYYSSPDGSRDSAQLSLPTSWFTQTDAYPYAPSTVAHVNGTTVTFTTVSGGQGTVGVDPRVTVDGVTAATTDGVLTLTSGTHTVAWSAVDSAGREEAWRSQVVTVP
jgi:hypothetical protein